LFNKQVAAMNKQQLSGVFLGTAGLALFGWVLFDASTMLSTLRLTGFLSEAAVAVAGLVLSAACIAAALFSFRPFNPRRDSRR
jgi:predicted lipoprotein